jgi:hypothetical protein
MELCAINFSYSGITENTVITLSDISGKIMLQYVIAPNDAVSVAHLPKGVYIVRIADQILKVIKK